MSAPYTLGAAFAAVVISGIIIYATRILPFAIFARREPPVLVRFIEKYGASLIMAVLAVYCFKDASVVSPPFGIPYAAGTLFTAVLYIKTRNTMLAIFTGTAAFVVLSRLL